MAMVPLYSASKSWSERVRQPIFIATALSVGLHGVLFAAVPLLSLGSDCPEEPKSVGVVELSPQDMARLPDAVQQGGELNPQNFQNPLVSQNNLPPLPVPDQPPLGEMYNFNLDEPLSAGVLSPSSDLFFPIPMDNGGGSNGNVSLPPAPPVTALDLSGSFSVSSSPTQPLPPIDNSMIDNSPPPIAALPDETNEPPQPNGSDPEPSPAPAPPPVPPQPTLSSAEDVIASRTAELRARYPGDGSEALDEGDDSNFISEITKNRPGKPMPLQEALSLQFPDRKCPTSTRMGIFVARVSSEGGQPTSVDTMQSTGYEYLNQEAIKAIEAQTFEPGNDKDESGNLIDALHTIKVEFTDTQGRCYEPNPSGGGEDTTS